MSVRILIWVDQDAWGKIASPIFWDLDERQKLSTSDFQSEVGEVFGEIGGELPAKFGRRFSSFFCGGNRQQHFPPKLHRKFQHQTSLQGSGLWRALKSVHSALNITCPKEAQKRGFGHTSGEQQGGWAGDAHKNVMTCFDECQDL